MDASRMKIVYSVSDRDARGYASRIGVALINADGSMNVKLDALPLSGEMLIRDYTPREPRPVAPGDGDMQRRGP